MERIRNLNLYQKSVLIIMIAMALVFAVVYPRTISTVGFLYQDAILVPREDNGATLYAGKIKGKESCFIVSGDKTVEFHYGDRVYGPYTAKEDPTAIPPKEEEHSGSMTGLELWEGDELMFRGGVLDFGQHYMLFDEDGGSRSSIATYVTSDGVVRDLDGNPVDLMRPSISTILALMNGPELTHKGTGAGWFAAVFICIINALSILFSEELFRFSLAFRIRNADRVEPSDWEMAGRYIEWTALTIVALVIFVIGLS